LSGEAAKGGSTFAMVDQIEQQLRDWVSTIVPDARLSFLAPGDGGTEPSIGLYLMDILPNPPARGLRTPPLQVWLRYLVTVAASDPAQSNRWLEDLVFAAMENPNWEVEPFENSATVWLALRAAPRPAFLVRVPLRRERPAKRAPLVRRPLIVQKSPMASLSGVVLGPTDEPLMGARVELPVLQQSTHTDSRGRFRFSSVPTEPSSKLLRVRARGREISVRTKMAAGGREGFVIRLQELED